MITWLDLDGDTEMDEAEPLISGIRVRILGPGGSFADLTDDSGMVQFPRLLAGSYVVESDDLPGWIRTTSRSHKVQVAPAETRSVAFGYRPPPIHLPLIFTEG